MTINLTKPAEGDVGWAAAVNSNFSLIEDALNAGVGAVCRHFENASDFDGNASASTKSIQPNTVWVFPLSPQNGNAFPGNMSFVSNRCLLNASFSAGAGAAHSSTFRLGLYTVSSDDLALSRVHEISTTIGSNGANATAWSGQRFIAQGITATGGMSAGERYYGVLLVQTSGASIANARFFGRHLFGNVDANERLGTVGVSGSSASTRWLDPFTGHYSATSNALPATIAASEVVKTAGKFNFVPHIIIETVSSAVY